MDKVLSALNLIFMLKKLKLAEDVFFGTVSGRNWNHYYVDTDKFALTKKKLARWKK
jgi:uncharacterized protein YjbK